MHVCVPHTSSHDPRMSYRTHRHTCAHLHTHLLHTHDILVGVNLKPAGAPQHHLHGGGVPETQAHAAPGVRRAWLPQLTLSLQQHQHCSQTQDCHPGLCGCCVFVVCKCMTLKHRIACVCHVFVVCKCTQGRSTCRVLWVKAYNVEV